MNLLYVAIYISIGSAVWLAFPIGKPKDVAELVASVIICLIVLAVWPIILLVRILKKTLS